jgi:hypothetical protein
MTLEPLVLRNVQFFDTGSYEGTPIQGKISAIDGQFFTVLRREVPKLNEKDGLQSSIIKIVSPDNTVWFDRKNWKETNFFKDPFQNTVFCYLEGASEE